LLSLGVVFHECLTGEEPFETTIHPVRLSTVVPRGLAKVVMKLLEKHPEARYRDGAEVANDLRKLLERVKGKRWDRPFKQPVPGEKGAPALPLASAPVPPEAPSSHALAPEPVPVNAKESEWPAPDTLLSVLPGDIPRVLDFGEAGTYTLEQCLGRGGMGEVYRARQAGAAGFVQRVAIKRLYPGIRPSEALSFVDEARVLSRLHHENIARVYAFHEWKGSYYLVMEYIEGHSLHALLELARCKEHRFSESVVCAIMADVAEALHHAHHATDEAGRALHIVHRDVSPTNILITREGRVVLVDFGVALSQHEGRVATRTGFTFIKGKAPYLSPEQVKHLPLDGRSDLFSVGTILMELLTGEAPFGWTADELTLFRIASVTPEYVASHLPGVSEPLRALCQKLLAQHPDQRFATGREVATALRRHARLGEGQQSIQAEVERLQALPDAKASPPAAEVTARSRSGGKRARRVLAFAAALMFATLVFVSWYVLRYPAVPGPSSPPLQGPTVALARLPERNIAPAPPVSPPSGPLASQPKREDIANAAAGPSGLAPGKHVPPSVVLADKNARIPLSVTAPPAARRPDGAAHVAVDSGESKSTARDQFVVALNATVQTTDPGATAQQPATLIVQCPAPPIGEDRELRAQLDAARSQLAKAKDEASMPEHLVAALLVSERPELASLVRTITRHVGRGIHTAMIDVYGSPRPGDPIVAVVLTLKNPRGNPAWKPAEGQVTIQPAVLHESLRPVPARWHPPLPVAVRSRPARILPGQTAQIALVLDRTDFNLDGRPVMVQLFREGKWVFEFELTPDDLSPIGAAQ